MGKWLEKSPERRLVLFMYDGSGTIISASRRARKEDQVRTRFIDLIGRTDIKDKLSKQIVVIFNSHFFGFEKIKLESAIDEEPE